MMHFGLRFFLFMVVCVGMAIPLPGQEARRRWEFMNEIRREKFDLILPEVMRENNVDMWITVVREGYEDPLTEDFGKAYVGSIGTCTVGSSTSRHFPTSIRKGSASGAAATAAC